MTTKLESQTIIPARDGFYLVRFDAGYEQLNYGPIIAWGIASDGRRAEVLPITVEGLADPASGNWFIKRSDGILCSPFTGNMDDRQALEYFKRRTAKRAGGSR